MQSGSGRRFSSSAGAAIALCFDGRRATRDLNAIFVPTDSVRRAAATVADREGLDPDWLNDAVKGFLPGARPQCGAVLRPDFYHRVGVRSGAEVWPAGLRAETGGFAH
jgi:hypothetical protein